MGGHDTTDIEDFGPDEIDFSNDAIVFYDGDCGLCHATVKFALKRDPEIRFRYAPLQGSTWAALRTAVQESTASTPIDANGLDLSNPPDSVILLEAGRLFSRTPAVVRLLRGLKSPWPKVAALLNLVPTALANGGYRLVAAVRRRLFAQPEGLCPLVPPELRARFLD